jgi:hypothetical protein
MRGSPFLRAVQAVVWLPETVLSGLRFCDELVGVLDEVPETRGESCRRGTVDGVVADADSEMKTAYGAKVHEQPRPTAMVCAVGVGWKRTLFRPGSGIGKSAAEVEAFSSFLGLRSRSCGCCGVSVRPGTTRPCRS